MKTINPETGKRILIGGATFNKLCEKYNFINNSWVPKEINNIAVSSNYNTIEIDPLCNNVFKKIIHIADIHFKTKMYDPNISEIYDSVFDNLSTVLTHYDPDSTIVIIVGDIFHNNLNLESDTIVYAKNKITEIAKKFKVIMTSGNHDIAVKFPDRSDCISAVFNGYENIYCITKTGRYKLSNLIFDFQDLFQSDKSIFDGLVKDNNYCYIALYHGTVIGSKVGVINVETTGELIARIADDGVDPKTLANYDLALLGHIHSPQFITDTIAYSGSMIQQHFGEQQRHGIIAWDIDTLTGEFIRLSTNIRYLTIVYKNGKVYAQQATSDDDVSEFDELIDYINDWLIHGEKTTMYFDFKLFLRIIANIDTITTSEHVDKLTEFIKKIVYIYNITRYNHREYHTNSTKRVLFSEEYNIPELLSQINPELIKVHEEISKGISEIVYNVNWTIQSLEWKNLFSYGDNKVNTLHFTNDILSIIAPNAVGKSSIIKILKLAMFNDVSRRSTASVINNKQNTGYVKCTFIANNEKYIVTRTLKRKIKNDTVTCSTAHSLIKFHENTEINLDIRDLEELTGHSDTFDQNYILTTNTNSNWCRMKPTALLEYFLHVTRTDTFEKYSEAGNEVNKVNVRNYNLLEGKLDNIIDQINNTPEISMTIEELINSKELLTSEINSLVIKNLSKPDVPLITEINEVELPKTPLNKLEHLLEIFVNTMQIDLQQGLFITHDNSEIIQGLIKNYEQLKNKLLMNKEILKTHEEKYKHYFKKHVIKYNDNLTKPMSICENIEESRVLLNTMIIKSGVKLCCKKNYEFTDNFDEIIETIKTLQNKLDHVTQNKNELQTEYNSINEYYKQLMKISRDIEFNSTVIYSDNSTLLDKRIKTPFRFVDNAENISLETLERNTLFIENKINILKELNGTPKIVPLVEDTINEVKNNNYKNVLECLESVLDNSQEFYTLFIKKEYYKDIYNKLLSNYVIGRINYLKPKVTQLKNKLDSAAELEESLKNKISKIKSKLAIDLGAHKNWITTSENYLIQNKGNEYYNNYTNCKNICETIENEMNEIRNQLIDEISKFNGYIILCKNKINHELLQKEHNNYLIDQENIAKRNELQQKISEIEKQIYFIESLKTLQEKRETIENEMETLDKRIKIIREYTQCMHRKIPLMALTNKLKIIEFSVNSILERYTKYRLQFAINNETLSVYFIMPGSELKVNYDSLSGCERILFQIAFIKSCSFGMYQSQILVIDEACDIIDNERFELMLPVIMNMLNELFTTTLFISHRKLPADLLVKPIKIEYTETNSEVHY